MPGVVANNKYGKTVAETSRKVFKPKKLDEKNQLFATTG